MGNAGLFNDMQEGDTKKPHVLKNPKDTLGKAYPNAKGNTECVEYVKQTLGAPRTAEWVEGQPIVKGDLTIPEGTAIATFVDGKFPQNSNHDQHAAIYIGQDNRGIIVQDQWNSKGQVTQRVIRWNSTANGRSNNGSAFSAIEW